MRFAIPVNLNSIIYEHSLQSMGIPYPVCGDMMVMIAGMDCIVLHSVQLFSPANIRRTCDIMAG